MTLEEIDRVEVRGAPGSGDGCMQSAPAGGHSSAVACLQDVEDEVDDEVSSDDGDEDYEGGGA
jgi:hypothetical protein